MCYIDIKDQSCLSNRQAIRKKKKINQHHNDNTELFPFGNVRKGGSFSPSLEREKDLSKVKGTAQDELLWGCCLVNSSGAGMPASMGSRHSRASDQSCVLGRDSGTGLRHSAQSLSTALLRAQELAVTSSRRIGWNTTHKKYNDDN